MKLALLAIIHAIILSLPMNPYEEVRAWAYNNGSSIHIWDAPDSLTIRYEVWCQENGHDAVLYHFEQLRGE